MTTATAPATALDAKLSKGPGRLGTLIFVAALLVGVLYVGVSLTAELPNPRAVRLALRSAGSRAPRRSGL